MNNLPKTLVIITIIISSMGIGLIMPVMPALLAEFGVTDVSKAVLIGGSLSLVFSLMQFLFSPLLGAMSDKYGRRPVLIVSLFATAFDYLLYCIAPSLWFLFIARLISGVTAATFSVTNAYMADICAPEERAKNFGLTGAAFGIGFVLGPAIGGVLSDFGPRAPFLAAALLAGINGCLTLFFLPESLKEKKAGTVNLRTANPFTIFVKLRQRGDISKYISILFLDNFSLMVYPAVWAYFCVAKFGWSGKLIGLSFATFGICMAIIQAGLIRVILKKFGEHKTATIGLAAGAVSYLVLSFISSGVLAFILSPVSTIRGITGPAINGIMSQQTDAQSQGELQGIVSGTSSLASLLAIPIMAGVFSVSTQPGGSFYWPGAPFFLSFLCMIIALVLVLRLKDIVKKPASESEL